MWLKLPIFAFIISASALAAEAKPRWQSCLPSDLQADEVISAERGTKSGDPREITIADKLNQLGARCRSRKLVDARGKQIHFYRLTGCWGNPPANYLELMEKQRKELARLRRRYRVVEISCNPSGVILQ